MAFSKHGCQQHAGDDVLNLGNDEYRTSSSWQRMRKRTMFSLPRLVLCSPAAWQWGKHANFFGHLVASHDSWEPYVPMPVSMAHGETALSAAGARFPEPLPSTASQWKVWACSECLLCKPTCGRLDRQCFQVASACRPNRTVVSQPLLRRPIRLLTQGWEARTFSLRANQSCARILGRLHPAAWEEKANISELYLRSQRCTVQATERAMRNLRNELRLSLANWWTERGTRLWMLQSSWRGSLAQG